MGESTKEDTYEVWIDDLLCTSSADESSHEDETL